MQTLEPTVNNTGIIDEDAQVVALAREGDSVAFDRLVMKYQDRIINACIRILGNRDDGRDAAQEAFVKAYQHLNGFAGNARFSTWLYQIAINTCRSRQRSWWSKMNKRAVELDAPLQEGNDSGHLELPDTSQLPTKDLQRARIASAIKNALRLIKPKHRELIVLRDIQGLSYEEIQKITGIASGTVKSRLARARESMQQHLKGLV